MTSHRPTLTLLIALLAMMLNGAQAHLGFAAEDGDVIQICNAHGAQSITLVLGDPVPASSKAESCCGDCVSVAAVVPSVPSMGTLKEAHQSWRLAIATHQIYPRSPLWPGAPPQGPPAIL
ncbi:MAG: hypothetical protein AAF337_03690 [Pseudomonadota bacterium]